MPKSCKASHIWVEKNEQKRCLEKDLERDKFLVNWDYSNPVSVDVH